MNRIYLDFAATTPLLKKVTEAMHQWNLSHFGNPSSVHYYGQMARARIEEARDVIANYLNIPSKNLFFTSGATEANNWILKSFANQFKDKHIVISNLEHPSVFNTGKYLKAQGFNVDFIEPDEHGLISVNQIKKALKSNTALISVMFVNNETGIVNPIQDIGSFCAAEGIKFHCDMVQALGKLEFNLTDLNIDFATFSAHKVHGPKGIGCVYIKKPAELLPYLHGGEQEAGRRAGTENVAGIIGFAEAVKWLDTVKGQWSKVQQLQSFFEQEIKKLHPEAVVIGETCKRSPFISLIAFPGFNNQDLLVKLDLKGLMVSAGSACSSGSLSPSRILQNMQLPERIVAGALRFSFSYLTGKDDLVQALNILNKVLI